MFSLSRLTLALGIAFSISASAQVHYEASPSTIVSVAGDRLEGAEPAAGVRAYLGIPYAKPPVGPLRWRPPQAFGPLSPDRNTPRQAVSHGSPCAQQKFGWNNGSAEHGTEDCLFLNVWAPASGKRHPVMVYIHGGSNTAGSAAEELSNGLQLVPRGVLLVTFDYRLGIFGFFRTPALDAESGYGGSGNYGLMDQIAALHWVHDNIASFGGDPANVTVFGQSAGAVDAGLLMASPLARGLFQRALEESGQVLGLMPTSSRQQSEDAWAPVAASLGADLATMRQLPTADVLAAEHEAPKPSQENFWGYRGASVDGSVLPKLPAKIFAEGGEAPVPLLLGSNVQEIVPKAQTAEMTAHLIEHSVGPQRASELQAVYAKAPVNPLEGDAGARFQTDRDFRCAVRQVAVWHASHGFPTFVYQFDRSAGSDRPAQHSSELRFVFGFPASPQGASMDARRRETAHSISPDDLTVSSEIQTFWTNFARTGAPGSTTDGQGWPRFDPARGNYLHFAAGSTLPAVLDNLGGESCSLLKGDVLPGAR